MDPNHSRVIIKVGYSVSSAKNQKSSKNTRTHTHTKYINDYNQIGTNVERENRLSDSFFQ